MSQYRSKKQRSGKTSTFQVKSASDVKKLFAQRKAEDRKLFYWKQGAGDTWRLYTRADDKPTDVWMAIDDQQDDDGNTYYSIVSYNDFSGDSEDVDYTTGDNIDEALRKAEKYQRENPGSDYNKVTADRGARVIREWK